MKSQKNLASYAKKVVIVTSGKGGVGKSTVSANVAVALAQDGYRVGLLDADIYGPDIPRLFGLTHQKMVWNDNNKIIPLENFDIKLMSVGFTTPQSDTPLVWRSSVAISALMQLLSDVEWGELDFLVIDMPPGTGDVQLSIIQDLSVYKAIIVTTPEQLSYDDVSRSIVMLQDLDIPIAGIIENMSYFIAPDTKIRYDIFGSGGGELLSLAYKIPLLAQIPLDIDIREKSNSGKIAVAFGDSKIKEYYKLIARSLTK